MRLTIGAGVPRNIVSAGVLALLVGSGVGSTVASAASGAAKDRSMTTARSGAGPRTRPWAGLIAPTAGQLADLRGSTVRRVTLSAGWDVLEPQPGVFNSVAMSQLLAQAQEYRRNGLRVVLDLGLQYPPSWIFAVPGPTRFVNQYGDVWHGELSTDVPNAVFNPAVRTAEAAYIAELAAVLRPAGLTAVRVGGLLSGELRYPPSEYNGHANSIWSFDPLAQAGSPVPGWRPGGGTATQIQTGLSYYFASLTNYQTWLMRTVHAVLPGLDQQILFPSWGLRPGMVDAAVASGLRGSTLAERNDLISYGLDWADQVKAIAATGYRATVYSTWLDAPSQGSSVAQIPPIAYLAMLATPYGLPLAGENTGGGGAASSAICLQRLSDYGLSGVMYMSGRLIDSGRAGLSLTELLSATSIAMTRAR